MSYVGISGSPCFGQAYINLGSRDESVPRCFRLREDNSGAISRGTPVVKENTKILCSQNFQKNAVQCMFKNSKT